MNRESLWPVSRITAALEFTDSSPDYDYAVNLTNVLNRVSILSLGATYAARAVCGEDTTDYTNMLAPGKFVLGVRSDAAVCSCCPCFAFLEAAYPDLVACGTATYTGVDPEGEDYTIYGRLSFIGIIPKNCRPLYVHPLAYGREEIENFTESIPATITITLNVSPVFGLVDAEQLVIASGGAFIGGEAVLSWTNPEGFKVFIHLIALQNKPEFSGTSFSASVSFPTPPIGEPVPERDPTEGIRITAETYGIRVAFIGQYAGRVVNLIDVDSNALTARNLIVPSNVLPPRIAFNFSLFKDAAGTELIFPNLIFVVAVAGDCPTDYTASTTDFPGLIVGTASVSWAND